MLDIKNYYEQLLTDQLWKITEDSAEAMSQTTLEDIACIALNKLPACYVRNVIDKGANLTELNYIEMNLAVSEAIAAAIEQVRLRPHDARYD